MSDRSRRAAARAPIITLLTDFGTGDAYVGIMKGVILGICPQATIVDLTHDVPPQSIEVGALLLRSAAAYFPAGTIHLAVVDPGVGSERLPILIRTAAGAFVGPDNGLLHPAASAAGIEEIVALERAEYRLPNPSRTFHGRDVFAPAAAHLARGAEPATFGRRLGAAAALALAEPVCGIDSVRGEVVHVDHFGNLITNIRERDLTTFRGRGLSVSIAGCDPLGLVESYSEVGLGELLAVIDSWGHVEIAVRNGSAARQLAAGVGAAVAVKPR